MTTQDAIAEFQNIIELLRSENGCPWDKEQTHQSLRPCIMEEAAELLAAIRIYEKTKNPENMKEELGDILLQVVMHSQIAKEEGLFTLEDVIREISEKMIRRHPHVFAEVKVNTTTEVLENWDEIKKKEKEGKIWMESPLREIPIELPALTRAAKAAKKIDKLYEPQADASTLISKLQFLTNSLGNIEAEDSRKAFEETMGDILWTIAVISQRKGFAAEQLLKDKTDDFVEKYEPNVEK